MNDFDLLETESIFDVYHNQNLIRDEIMLALNIFPIFDICNYDDVSDFLWYEYNIFVDFTYIFDDFTYHVYCPEVLSHHLQFYFERDLDLPVVIEILY